MGASRFVKEASLEPAIAHMRELTGKPVVSVGRFTSPETMVSQVKRGVLDLVGAARPSIADPFLPAKIREGRLDEIRECIGCNICYAGDARGVPIRCTQNPTMGEEWRRGWHPERVPNAPSDQTALVVGAGPAGLEAAHILSKRGYAVMLAEATGDLGGRVTRESRLPGLSEWVRVRDYRVQQFPELPNLDVYPGSRMSAEDVLAAGAEHVFIATGSRWRRDGTGRHHKAPLPGSEGEIVLTPDDIMDGKRPDGPVVVFDDDRYYMAAVLCELLAGEGADVTYVTTAGVVASWSGHTDEQYKSQARLIELGVTIKTSHAVTRIEDGMAVLGCVYSGRETPVECAAFVPVTSREPNDGLWQELTALVDKGVEGAPHTLLRIGDCKAPGIIATAVYDGHRAARGLGIDTGTERRERAIVAR